MSGLDSQLHLHHPGAKLGPAAGSHHHHPAFNDPTAALLNRNRVSASAAVANRPAVPLPSGNSGQNLVRVSANDNSQLLISRALTSSLSGGSGISSKAVLSGGGLQYSAGGSQQPKMSPLIEPQMSATIAGQHPQLTAASSQQQQRYQELLSQRLLAGGGGQIVRLTAGSNSDFGSAVQPTTTARPMSVQAVVGSGESGAYRVAGGGVVGGGSGVVQTLPRNQGMSAHQQQQQPQIHQEFTHQECFFHPI
jgi:hypothetical protein